MTILFDPTEQMLIACAVKEVVFLNFQTGVIQPKKGTNWMKYGGQQTVLCGIYMGSTLITGVFNGSLLEWKGNSISQARKAHDGPCNALYSWRSTPGFISGGKDGQVIVWTDKFERQKVINLKEPSVNSYTPQAISVCENEAGNKILVGTRGGEIIEFTDKKS